MTGKRYTVADLRAALADLPDDAPLFVDGYEGGYSDMQPPVPTKIKLDVHPPSEWWYGRHGDDWDDDGTALNGWVFVR